MWPYNAPRQGSPFRFERRPGQLGRTKGLGTVEVTVRVDLDWTTWATSLAYNLKSQDWIAASRTIYSMFQPGYAESYIINLLTTQTFPGFLGSIGASTRVTSIVNIIELVLMLTGNDIESYWRMFQQFLIGATSDPAVYEDEQKYQIEKLNCLRGGGTWDEVSGTCAGSSVPVSPVLWTGQPYKLPPRIKPIPGKSSGSGSSTVVTVAAVGGLGLLAWLFLIK